MRTTPAPLGPDTASDGRDDVLDLVRAGSLAVVVIWHWVFTTVRWAPDGPHVGNPIGDVGGLWLLTWVAQVMPLFFIVGGALHAIDDRPALRFWIHRLRRLVPPALPLLGGAATVALLARALDRPDVARGVVLLISPLWFLAVYLVLVALTPPARWLHRRFGWGALVVGAVTALVVDRARIAGTLEGGWVPHAQFVLMWAVVHQLGFHLWSLRAAPVRTRALVCGAGFAALAGGVLWGGYPASMVGVPRDATSNMSPPTVMVLFLGVAQLGLLTLVDDRLRDIGGRHRRALGAARTWSMTVYVWHMLAFVAFWAFLVLAGSSVGHRVDAGWWAVRPLWFVGPLAIAVPLCALVGRRPGPAGRAPRMEPVAPVRDPERAR